MLVLLLDDLSDCKANPEQVELTEIEGLIPQDGNNIDLEAVCIQSREPRVQQHVTGGLILHHV